MTAYNHYNNHGCMKCSMKLKPQCQPKMNTQDFIERANKIHNNKYDYSLTEYKHSHYKVKIICKKHGKFEQEARRHLKAIGCQICKESKGEIKISFYLKKRGIKFIQQKRFKGCKNKYTLPFDFYLPDINLCIEYDGIQHYRGFYKGDKEEYLKTIKINDKIKTKFCINNNIKLVRIPYTKFNDVEKIMEENIC